MRARPRAAARVWPVSWSRVRWILTLALTLTLGACASLPEDYPRPPSHTDRGTADTRLGRIVARLTAGRSPADSGHRALNSGLDAFAARIVLMREATTRPSAPASPGAGREFKRDWNGPRLR